MRLDLMKDDTKDIELQPIPTAPTANIRADRVPNCPC